MKVHHCKQYTPEWWEIRRGIPTCSQFHRIITATKQELAAAADDYIDELIADRISQQPAFFTDRPQTRDMQHGAEVEDEARRAYEFRYNATVQQVGFVTDDEGKLGGSPDGLIGDEGGLELKCPQMKTHVRYLRQQVLPPEYMAQVHGHLIVSGRPWWDFFSYAGADVEPFAIRVVPTGFTRNLRVTLLMFLEKLEKTIAKLKGGK